MTSGTNIPTDPAHEESTDTSQLSDWGWIQLLATVSPVLQWHRGQRGWECGLFWVGGGCRGDSGITTWQQHECHNLRQDLTQVSVLLSGSGLMWVRQVTSGHGVNVFVVFDCLFFLLQHAVCIQKVLRRHVNKTFSKSNSSGRGCRKSLVQFTTKTAVFKGLWPEGMNWKSTRY